MPLAVIDAEPLIANEPSAVTVALPVIEPTAFLCVSKQHLH